MQLKLFVMFFKDFVKMLSNDFKRSLIGFKSINKTFDSINTQYEKQGTNPKIIPICQF